VVNDVFKPIFVGTELEEAAMTTLSKWMPTYLQEIELQLGRTRDLIPAPRLYTTRNEFTSFPDDQMPMCVVVSTGLADPPLADGEGTYSGWFALGVGFAAAAKDAESSGFLAKVYGAAGRAILLHYPSLGGICEGVEWADESYDDLVSEEERTIRACYSIYRVKVGNLVTRYAGPSDPIPDPVTQPGSQTTVANIVTIDDITVG
jgi:hypothetical protein